MKPTFQRYRSRFVRVAVGLFVLATCVRAWNGPFSVAYEARAQIPDSGKQRNMLLAEARRTNELLDEIRQILKAGTLNVRVAGADNQADTASPTQD